MLSDQPAPSTSNRGLVDKVQPPTTPPRLNIEINKTARNPTWEGMNLTRGCRGHLHSYPNCSEAKAQNSRNKIEIGLDSKASYDRTMCLGL